MATNKITAEPPRSINDICFIVQARLNSERVPKKMTRPFAGSTLLDICLSKLSNSSIIPKDNIYLSCYETEIKEIGEKHNINIYNRSKSSANEEKDMKIIFEWHNKINLNFSKKYKYAILISACNPLLSITSIDDFVSRFIESEKEGAFSVFEKRNYFWDSDNNSITDWKDLPIMNTKIVDPVYEGAHCLYATRLDIIEDGYFMDTKSPAKPLLFCLDELECFDIDFQWQFDVGEVLYGNFSKQKSKNKSHKGRQA